MIKFLEKHATSIVICLLVFLFFIEFTSSLTESQIVDEGVHLASGYLYLVNHDFNFNPEHPPLLKILAALPLKFINPIVDPAWQEQGQWTFAYHFLYDNRYPADELLLLGRLPTMLISILLSLAVFLITRRFFGKLVALLALTFCVFEPNLIAHSRYITTDIGVTLLFFLSIYYFGEFLNNPNGKSVFLAAVFFALAQVAKFSAVILIPIFLLLIIIKCLHPSRKEFISKVNKKFILVSLFVFIFVTALIIHLSYLGNLTIPAQDADGQALLNKRNVLVNFTAEKSFFTKIIYTIIDPASLSGRIIDQVLNSPVPFYHYFRGFVHLFLHDYFGHLSYLLGRYYDYGIWYYFPVAYLVKTPLALMILLVITFVYLLTKFICLLRRRISQILIKQVMRRNQFIATNQFFKKIFRQLVNYPKGLIGALADLPFYYFLFLIPIFVYLLISMFSTINIGVRHIFPIFPFIFIIVARIICLLIKQKKQIIKIILLGIIVFYIINSLLIYPNYLAHFSYQFGGPNYGYYYLLDSNLDWGQDAKKLSRYMEKNNIPEIYFAYFGVTNLAEYNISVKRLPTIDQAQEISEINGFVAISATRLYSEDGAYAWLRPLRPVDKIGYSIFIYDLRQLK